MTPPDKPDADTNTHMTVHASITVRLNPEARLALARVMAAERAKVAGSLIAPPNAQDIVRGLILQAAKAIDFGETFRRELTEQGKATQAAHEQTTMPAPSESLRRVLDAQGIKNTDITPDFGGVAPRIPQELIDALKDQREALSKPMPAHEATPAPSFLPRIAPVSATVLLHDRCTHAIENRDGIECHCLLKPGHEGWHEDSAADWTWYETGGHIVEARLSEQAPQTVVGVRIGNVLVHEGTPPEQRIIVPIDDDQQPMRCDMGTVALLAQANVKRDADLFAAYLRAQNGRERFMTWNEFVANCRAQNSILERVPPKDGAL